MYFFIATTPFRERRNRRQRSAANLPKPRPMGLVFGSGTLAVSRLRLIR